MSYDLQRFILAQSSVIENVRKELAEGRKRTHWMWFVFPQHIGLGTSSMARRYGIGSLDEAKAYVAHPVLGPRLVALTELVLAVADRSAHDIFGWPDDLKFRSSMTLFALTHANPVFQAALDRLFGGVGDALTLARLAGDST
jgi:uncharacterized protein (DUF1810 family)